MKREKIHFIFDSMCALYQRIKHKMNQPHAKEMDQTIARYQVIQLEIISSEHIGRTTDVAFFKLSY